MSEKLSETTDISPERIKENEKQEANHIASKRGGLLARIIGKALEMRGAMAKSYEEASDAEKLVYEKLKEVPVLRGALEANEGVIGAEPGRKLNTIESLVKYATGVCMMAIDVGKLRTIGAGGNEAIAPAEENNLKKDVLESIRRKLEELRRQDPESAQVKILGALYDFLRSHKPETHYYETKI